MIVYFSASARNVQEDMPVYTKIVDTIYGQGHHLATNWVDIVKRRKLGSKKGFLDADLEYIVQEAVEGMGRADVVIAEVSGGSCFGVGYEVALAIQQRKPTLLLAKDELSGGTYARGLKQSVANYKEYKLDNLVKIVEEFLDENAITGKDFRFNFVIDNQIYNYLRLKSFSTGKTKAELVRDLLLKDIRNTEQ